MDIQAQTNCTIQLPMLTLEKWAIDLVENGYRQELLDLLSVLPFINDLRDLGLGFNILNVSQNEMDALIKIAMAGGSSLKKSKRQRKLAAFKDSLIQQVKVFQDLRLQIGGNQQVHLNEMARALQSYQRKAGLKFLTYLSESHATIEQIYAFDYYLQYQKQTVKGYLFYESLAFKSFALNIEEKGYAFGSRKLSKSVNGKKIQDEKTKHRYKSQEKIPKKWPRQELLNTERRSISKKHG